uniref:Uncharacterized protein MANES_01G102400 n=1 Tax=Rhizophora mucronata TaxID=61149 RepID=A0A2P2M6Y1_RHIMU
MGIVILCILLLDVLLSTTIAQTPQPYKPTDLILLNCGESSPRTSSDGRKWEAEAKSQYLPSTSQTSSTSRASEQDSSVVLVPYMTARVIHSKITYTFPVSSGAKFVRLYFYPATYSGLNKTTSFFSVAANRFTLLSNFSAYLTVSAPHASASIVKEFIVTVQDKQQLEIAFTPTPSSFAFINGIEIVSMPNGLYTKDMDDPYVYVRPGNPQTFYFDDTTALETVYRLNVGGRFVSSVKDSGLFRRWLEDSSYIFAAQFGVTHSAPDYVPIEYTNKTPAYVAPTDVYKTKRTMGKNSRINLNYNLTWLFSVDSGFTYLVRLHFCETESVKPGERVFFIFINNMTAEQDEDVMYWSGGTGVPVYKDFVVSVAGGSSGKEDLWLALHPNIDSGPKYADAILNGLEIFKLNRSDGDIAGPNPEPVAAPPKQLPISIKKTRGKRTLPLLIAIGAVIAALFAFSVFFCFFVRQRRKKMQSTQKSALPTERCRHFTLAEIRSATRNFDEQNLIGVGGFGNVYKGYHESVSMPVAIKRLNSSSEQGIREFRTEIEMLSRLRHVHLVPLIGYCDDRGEMILVYEYMPNGALQDHLYKTDSPPLPWKQRLEICIGAARGLHYLHSGTNHTIIHRDIKPTNILLDENWVAKVSDFGLSKVGPTSQTPVNTVVKGSFGYIDPEYCRRQKLTEKSDVYSFGVVLLEVLCARRPLIPTLPRDQVSLAEWGRSCYQRGTFDQIIDPYLKGDVAPECLKKFAEISYNCVHDIGSERPTMVDVVWGLEFALQLQEAAEKNRNGPDRVNFDREIPLLPRGDVVSSGEDDDNPFSGSRITLGASGTSTTLSYSDGARTDAVFSEIMNSAGR